MLTKNSKNNVNGLEFEPKEWKKFTVENSTNCYIYALNLPKNPYTNNYYQDWKYIQPGRLGGNIQREKELKAPYDKKEIFEMVKKDLAAIGMEIVESTYDEVREGNWWKVALAFDNNCGFFDVGDYHWYRQNTDGTWSHKPGSCKVRNTDASNMIIENPETCDRGRYKIFAGFFMIRKKRGRKPNIFKVISKQIADKNIISAT